MALTKIVILVVILCADAAVPTIRRTFAAALPPSNLHPVSLVSIGDVQTQLESSVVHVVWRAACVQLFSVAMHAAVFVV